MSIKRTILRVSSLTAMAGAGYVILQDPGIFAAPAAPQAHAQMTADVAVDVPPAAPALPFVADSAGVVTLPTQAAVTVEGGTEVVLAQASVDAASVVPVSAPVEAETTPERPLSPFGLPCGLSVHSEAMPGAMVALDVMAPCRPGMRIDIEHAGLTISAQTDAAGLLTVDFPALETPAFFTLRLADGEEAFTLAGLPDLIDIGRAAVSWQGNLGIELHAFEGGAEFGAPGHVWQDAPGSSATASIGTGGFHTQLGDASLEAPRMAQVYSYPRTMAEMPDLSVDIPVTAETCGQPVRASSHQITDTGRIETMPITLVLPGCDAVGDYLVLQNLFDTLRLAAN